MVFEHIDKLKEEYTDKFVTVDDSRPELKRFDGLVGRVKTVNMSGRALVEFDNWVNNIGWYDIDIDFLKVVDESEVAEKTAKAKVAPKKTDAKASKLEKSRESAGKPSGKAGGGMSMDDILAAARSGAAPAAKKETKPASARAEERPAKASGGQMSVAEMLAAARASDSGEAKSAPAKQAESKQEATAAAPAKDPKSMSVAEMLAAARSADSGEGGPAAASPAPAKKETPPAGEKPAAAKQLKTPKGVDTSGMTVEQMLALARDQASGKAPPAEEKTEAVPQEPPAAPEPEPEPAAKAAPAPPGELPQDVADIVAFCRGKDG